MKSNRYAKFLIMTALVSGLALLSACSKKPGVNNGNDAGGSDAGASQTYGMNSAGGYDANGFKVNALSAPSDQTYYFAFDSSDLRQEDMQALHIQSNYLATHPNAVVRLEGNTDNRGSREYNIALGWRRDQSVARIMEQEGVHPNQIKMVSYGKENPAVPGNDQHDWALNRRVEFVYKNKG